MARVTVVFPTLRVSRDFIGYPYFADLGAIRAVAARAKEAGIPALVHFMNGLPGETKVDINRTLAFAIELFEQTGAWPSVQFATPRGAALPGRPGSRALRAWSTAPTG